ncbi:hypothetical protein L7F22_040572 [Adiantum nelumboides]|nr:hypothetical protein [Adiantum nelumboides]
MNHEEEQKGTTASSSRVGWEKRSQQRDHINHHPTPSFDDIEHYNDVVSIDNVSVASASEYTNSGGDSRAPPMVSSGAAVGGHVGNTMGYSNGAPCGACKFLRRKCVKDCVFAPYFGAEHGAARFAAVHKIFGASNVNKLLRSIPVHKRFDAVITISYEAQARITNPVYGCVATIADLQQQVECVDEDSGVQAVEARLLPVAVVGSVVAAPLARMIVKVRHFCAVKFVVSSASGISGKYSGRVLHGMFGLCGSIFVMALEAWTCPMAVDGSTVQSLQTELSIVHAQLENSRYIAQASCMALQQQQQSGHLPGAFSPFDQRPSLDTAHMQQFLGHQMSSSPPIVSCNVRPKDELENTLQPCIPHPYDSLPLGMSPTPSIVSSHMRGPSDLIGKSEEDDVPSSVDASHFHALLCANHLKLNSST